MLKTNSPKNYYTWHIAFEKIVLKNFFFNYSDELVLFLDFIITFEITIALTVALLSDRFANI